MRKASKKIIAANLARFNDWETRVTQQASAQSKDTQRLIRDWISDVRSRIESGENGYCLQAKIRSTNRVLEDFESGFYARTEYRGNGNATFYLS